MSSGKILAFQHLHVISREDLLPLPAHTAAFLLVRSIAVTKILISLLRQAIDELFSLVVLACFLAALQNFHVEQLPLNSGLYFLSISITTMEKLISVMSSFEKQNTSSHEKK